MLIGIVCGSLLLLGIGGALTPLLRSVECVGDAPCEDDGDPLALGPRVDARAKRLHAGHGTTDAHCVGATVLLVERRLDGHPDTITHIDRLVEGRHLCSVLHSERTRLSKAHGAWESLCSCIVHLYCGVGRGVPCPQSAPPSSRGPLGAPLAGPRPLPSWGLPSHLSCSTVEPMHDRTQRVLPLIHTSGPERRKQSAGTPRGDGV